MRIAIIGRSETLFESTQLLLSKGHEIVCLVTSKEAPEYTKTSEDFRKLAEDLRVPFALSPSSANLENIVEKTRPQIGVSCNYTFVIPEAVISRIPLGILNAHGGDLPRYRGNACQAWAIINGEDRIGLCIHRMVGGELDSGDIISRKYLEIDQNTKIGSVLSWINQQVPSMMRDAVEILSVDPNFILERQSTDSKSALRCYPRNPDDGRIDWRLSATEVLRLINASGKPYSGAFCTLEGNKVIIWDAELVDDGEVFSAVPGQVVKVGLNFVDVACGVGKLRLRSIQRDSDEFISSVLVKSIRQRFK